MLLLGASGATAYKHCQLLRACSMLRGGIFSTSIFEMTCSMLFAIRFVDKPNSLALRQTLMAAHIAWLDQVREFVLVGGSLRHSPEQAPVGGLWIVELESKAAVEALMKQDPFFTGGLRESWEILHWSKAFEDRKVPV